MERSTSIYTVESDQKRHPTHTHTIKTGAFIMSLIKNINRPPEKNMNTSQTNRRAECGTILNQQQMKI